MAAPPPFSVVVFEHCQISPPPNSTPTTSIPLTFLDIPGFLCPPIQRILVYEFHHPTHHFTQNILPKLKHSLALTLQHFFPLAGTVVYPLPQQEAIKPHILYKDGDSFVPFSIAESNGNFDHLCKNYPKDATVFDPLVPLLRPAEIGLFSPEIQVPVQLLRHLVAFQVTIFPNVGICIGVSYHHTVCDGKAINHFLKSWASNCKSNGDSSPINKPMVLPCHDRAILFKDDPEGIQTTNFYKQCCELELFGNQTTGKTPNESEVNASPAPTIEDKMYATFVMGHNDIVRVRNFITSQFEKNHEIPPLPHVSRFVTTCAFIWICLMKTENIVSSDNEKKLETSFSFPADRRGSKDFYVPNNYFGNCLTVCFSSVKRSELVGENGLITAARSIMKEIKELDVGLVGGEKRVFLEALTTLASDYKAVKVASSPKFGVYEIDFGWGRPRKVEHVHIAKTGSISLTECRDEEGGIEVGIALPNAEMEVFVSIFELGLKSYV